MTQEEAMQSSLVMVLTVLSFIVIVGVIVFIVFGKVALGWCLETYGVRFGPTPDIGISPLSVLCRLVLPFG